MLGVIPQDVKDKHPYAILAFENAKQTLEKIDEISKKSSGPDRDKNSVRRLSSETIF